MMNDLAYLVANASPKGYLLFNPQARGEDLLCAALKGFIK